jgi:hypothetical protein
MSDHPTNVVGAVVVVGFTTICAISAYRHCEFEPYQLLRTIQKLITDDF